MSWFRTKRERKLWSYVVLVIIAIFSTLALGGPLSYIARNDNVSAAFFLFCMFIIAVLILFYGLRDNHSKQEFIVWIGLLAVYSMLFLRLTIPERSHLIEYSILAIFVHRAISERLEHINNFKIGIYALLVTSLIGILDELLQIIMPNRVFDVEDIVFNSSAALFAITSINVLKWVRKKVAKSHKKAP